MNDCSTVYQPGTTNGIDAPAPAAGVVVRRNPRQPVTAPGLSPVHISPGGCDGAPVEVTRGHKLQKGVAIIDWLSFTIHAKDGESVRDLASWLLSKFPEGATPLERGSMGYTSGWRLPAGGLLLFNPQRPDMGVHCSCPSGLLSLLDVSPQAVINMVLVEGGHFTRVDVAIDTDQVPMAVVVAAQERGELVSRAQDRRLVHNYRDGSETLYIGAGSSRRLVRFYDKALEQGLEDGGVWTRCEVQFRADQAQTAACHIAGGVGLCSLIVSSVDFRYVDQDSNVSRCPQLDWWAAWVGQVERVSFAIRKAATEVVERAYEWVRRQVGPTLAFLDRFFGKDPLWLYQLCDANEHRIPPERRALLAGGAYV